MARNRKAAFDASRIFASPVNPTPMSEPHRISSAPVSEPHPFARPETETRKQREGWESDDRATASLEKRTTENASASGGNVPFTPPTPHHDLRPLMKEILGRHRESNLRILDVEIVGEGEGSYALVTVEVVTTIEPGSGMSMILNALYGYADGLVPLDDKREDKRHLAASYAVRSHYSVPAAKLVLRVPRDGNFTIERRIGDS